MREFGGSFLFSASDLMRFMGCPHATTLDLMHLRGEGPEPGEDSEDAALLQKQGDAHEMAHLARLKSSGRSVVELPRDDLASGAKGAMPIRPWARLRLHESWGSRGRRSTEFLRTPETRLSSHLFRPQKPDAYRLPHR